MANVKPRAVRPRSADVVRLRWYEVNAVVYGELQFFKVLAHSSDHALRRLFIGVEQITFINPPE